MKTYTKAMQAQVDAWNGEHKIGTPVTVVKDNGTELDTTTRSEAWMLSGHTPVIQVDGLSGCYLLDRVTPRSI